jgi:hypothetical protein
VRNFDWRSDTDYTVRWESRTFDLKRLRSVDMAVSYWMGPAIAHTIVTFGFAPELRQEGASEVTAYHDETALTPSNQPGYEYIAFSIEIRKERGESFSAIAGFFKQFELSLIAADERDILRVRTNVREEDMYLYRVVMPVEAMRSLFLAYVSTARELESTPRFYDTLTANCTTLVYEMARRIVKGLPLDWRLLASGYLPEYLARVGALTPGYSLEDLRRTGRITERAKAADKDPHFSQAIRQGMLGNDAL